MAALLPNTYKYMRIDPYGKSTGFTPDDIIDFYLPNSGFIKLNTIAMFFNINFLTSAGVPVSSLANVALPRDTECMIQRLEIFVNGVCVNNINDYGLLFRSMCDHAFDGTELYERQRKRNGGTNGNPAVAAANSFTAPFICQKWFGLLNEDVVIDLSKNSIHIRITVAPRVVIASANGTDTFSFSNVYLTAQYFEKYTGELKSMITYEDFKSISEFAPTLNNTTTLKVFTKNLDYVLATNWNTSRVIISAFNGTVLSTSYFMRTMGDTWNILINGRPLFQFDPTVADTDAILKTIFPKGINMTSPNSFTPFSSITFLCGAKIGFTNATPEEIEISYITKGGAVNNYAQVVARTLNELPLNI